MEEKRRRSNKGYQYAKERTKGGANIESKPRGPDEAESCAQERRSGDTKHSREEKQVWDIIHKDDA